MVRRARRKADAQAPELAVAQTAGGDREILGSAEHLARLLEQQLAVGREAHRPAGSHEQRHAERLFELLNPFGQGRLGDVQPRGGPREMEFVGERRERRQGLERRLV